MRRRGQGAGAIGEGSFTVDLARTAVENFVPDGESIFNIPAPAGINITYSFELGTCEQRVISGNPEQLPQALLKRAGRNCPCYAV